MIFFEIVMISTFNQVLYELFLGYPVVLVLIYRFQEFLYFLIGTVFQHLLKLVYLDETCFVSIEVVEGIDK